MLNKLLLIALAGSLGALARYGLSGIVPSPADSDFPWGTVAVNILGCFLFGLVWSLYDRGAMSTETRIIVLTGFLGAFTTFSTFVFESGQMMREAQWMLAVGHITLQNVVGVLALFAGLRLGELV